MSAVIHSLGFSVPLGRIAQKEAANFATRTSLLDEKEDAASTLFIAARESTAAPVS